jgi:hypothetical protein
MHAKCPAHLIVCNLIILISEFLCSLLSHFPRRHRRSTTLIHQQGDTKWQLTVVTQNSDFVFPDLRLAITCFFQHVATPSLPPSHPCVNVYLSIVIRPSPSMFFA